MLLKLEWCKRKCLHLHRCRDSNNLHFLYLISKTHIQLSHIGTSRASVKFLFRSVWKICCPFRRMSSSRVGLVWIAANTACITFSRASTTAIPFTTLSPSLFNAAETCCFTTDRFITSLCVHVCGMRVACVKVYRVRVYTHKRLKECWQ